MGKSRKRPAPKDLNPEESKHKRAERKRRRTTWRTDVSEENKHKAIKNALGPNKYSWMNQTQGNPLADSLARLGDVVANSPTTQSFGVGPAHQPTPLSSSSAQEASVKGDIDTLQAAPETETEAISPHTSSNTPEDKDANIDELEAVPKAELEADDEEEECDDDEWEAQLADLNSYEPKEVAENEATSPTEPSSAGQVESRTPQPIADATEELYGTNEVDLEEEEILAMLASEPAAEPAPQQAVEDDDDNVVIVSSRKTGTKENPLEIPSSRETSPCVEEPVEKATAAPKEARKRARPQKKVKVQAPQPIEVESEEEVDDGDEEEELFGLLDAALKFLTN